MGVSKNRGAPKSSILIRFSIINHPFWGTTIFGNIHIVFWCLFVQPHFQDWCLKVFIGCTSHDITWVSLTKNYSHLMRMCFLSFLSIEIICLVIFEHSFLGGSKIPPHIPGRYFTNSLCFGIPFELWGWKGKFPGIFPGALWATSLSGGLWKIQVAKNFPWRVVESSRSLRIFGTVENSLP